MRRTINPRLRSRVIELDNYTCRLCNITADLRTLEVDHILPISLGGSNEISNLQTLCWKCNLNKRDKLADNIKDYSDTEDVLKMLDKIKEVLEKYKHLSWQEFLIVYKVDPLFRFNRLSLNDLRPLFKRISIVNERVKEASSKSSLERDKLIYYVWKNHSLTQEEISKIIGTSRQTVNYAIAKFRDTSKTSLSMD